MLSCSVVSDSCDPIGCSPPGSPVLGILQHEAELWWKPSVSDTALFGASLVAQVVENLPAVQETPVQSWGWEDPLGKGMTLHSSILSWRIPWTEEPDGLQSVGSWRAGHSWSDEHECTCSIVQVGRFPVLLGTVGGKRKISRWNLILKICSNLPVLSS